ncbi:MAG TPA: aminotransferase class III-fold pyridoxal phosphate-dependent enzyme, partial [Nitrospira sp.]|nr:aminotransferase class III-fold pyridoxal phosphate-dependent enzyme [Nitrospira sp.]
TEEIYKAFLGKYEDYKTFFHGHSYTGNPLGCAVALANLDVFMKERTLRRLQPKIKLMSQLLRPLRDLRHVGDIRQRGFMVGIELVQDSTTRNAYPPEARIGHRVAREARARGLLIRPLGHIIVLIPPLSTDLKTLTRMVDIMSRSIATVTKNDPSS